MIQNKITLETTEEDFFEYMKFKESVSRCAVFIYFDRCSTNERMVILDKSKAFEKVNEKIKLLENDLYTQQIKNSGLRDEMAEKITREKSISTELRIQNETLQDSLKKKFRWFEFWKK